MSRIGMAVPGMSESDVRCVSQWLTSSLHSSATHPDEPLGKERDFAQAALARRSSPSRYLRFLVSFSSLLQVLYMSGIWNIFTVWSSRLRCAAPFSRRGVRSPSLTWRWRYRKRQANWETNRHAVTTTKVFKLPVVCTACYLVIRDPKMVVPILTFVLPNSICIQMFSVSVTVQ